MVSCYYPASENVVRNYIETHHLNRNKKGIREDEHLANVLKEIKNCRIQKVITVVISKENIYNGF